MRSLWVALARRLERHQMNGAIHPNAFTMNCVGHQSPELWTHPRDRAAE